MRKKPSPRLSPTIAASSSDHPSELEFRHFASIPIADLARSHQSDAVMGDDVIEQSLQIFNAMRDTGDVGVNGDRHDPRVGCALEVQPVELIGTALQKLLGRKMLQRMDDDIVGLH